MKTPNGYRNIEDIRAGDKVLSYNEKTKLLEVQTVAQTFIRKTDRIYTLVYDTGTKLQTTATHPFYIEGKGWVKAADLHVGDDSLLAGEVSPLDVYGGARLQNVSYRQSQRGVIVGITVEERAETVYNFEVKETHTYLVGESDVVVHNADYGGSKGVNRMKADMHQVDYTNANLQQEAAIKDGKYSKKEEARIRKQLEANLRSRQMDYIGDQLKDYRDSHGCDATGPCSGIDLFGAKLIADSEKFVQYKLKQFDSPVVGRDFLTDAPVKMPDVKSAQDIPDVKEAVDASVKEAEWWFIEGKGGNRYTNGVGFLLSFIQKGYLDFKHNEKIMGPDAEAHGYQDYVRYGVDANGKPVILQQSDLGNMAYGDFTRRFGGFDLGAPTDSPKFEFAGASLYSSGHYRQLNDWEEWDRPRDQRAMEHGYYCGMDVSRNCATSNTGYPKELNHDGRVLRVNTPRGQRGLRGSN